MRNDSPLAIQAQPYIPQVDNYNAIEAFVRRIYNPDGDPNVDRTLVIQPYAYTVEAELTLAGSPSSEVIQIAANADFVLTDLTFTAFDTLTPAADITPAVLLTLTDIGSQQPLTSEAIMLPTLAVKASGSARNYVYPRIISGRSGLQVQMQNVSGTVSLDLDYYVYLSLIGVQVYRAGN